MTPRRRATAPTAVTTALPWRRRRTSHRTTSSSPTSPTARSNANRRGRSTPNPSSTRVPGSPTWCGSRTTGGRLRRPTSGPSSSTRAGRDSRPARARVFSSPTTPSTIRGRRRSRTLQWRLPAVASISSSRQASTRRPATPRGSRPVAARSVRVARKRRSWARTDRFSARVAALCSRMLTETSGWPTRRGRAAARAVRTIRAGRPGGCSSRRCSSPTSTARSPATRRPRRTASTWWRPTAGSSISATCPSAAPRAAGR